MPLIAKLRIGYNLITPADSIPIVIDGTEIINWGSSNVQKKIIFTKGYSVSNIWTT